MNDPNEPGYIKPKKATWRMGARQRERIQWTVVGIIVVLLFFALRPTYFYVVDRRDYQTCQSNSLQIAEALGRYSSDWDEYVPPAPNWRSSIEGYLAARTGTGFSLKDIFHCPRDRTTGESSYVYNGLLGGANMGVRIVGSGQSKVKRPDRAPLIMEIHGSAYNGLADVADWDALAKVLTRPHVFTGPKGITATGIIITGSRKAVFVDDDKLLANQGNAF